MLTANVENLTLTGTAALDGTGNNLSNTITGNFASNVLNGGGGADTLNGGAGIDRLEGGSGADTYVVDTTTDVIAEAADAGNDLVRSSITFSIADIANVENLELTGTGNINATGNASDNVLTGNLGTNILTGGAGNDTYILNKTADAAVENAGEGIDTVIATGPAGSLFSLAENVENLQLGGLLAADATGNGLDNAITGNGGVNVLNGLDGNDTLKGGIGNDTLNGGSGNDVLDGGFGADAMAGGDDDDLYVVNDAGDAVTEGSGAASGTDTIVSTLASFTLSEAGNVENLTLGGASAINGSGNSSANVITGNKAVNVINAGAGNDTVNSGSGNDVITGGAGSDIVNGGGGKDTFVFAAVGDAAGDEYASATVRDRFDFTAIDIDPALPGQQHLKIDVDDAITAGEIDIVTSGQALTVSIYLDGDATAEASFTISLAQGVKLSDLVFVV